MNQEWVSWDGLLYRLNHTDMIHSKIYHTAISGLLPQTLRPYNKNPPAV